jgi:hypothetical protein
VASLLLFPVVRSDGTIPFVGTNYSSRSATWVDPARKSQYTMNWNLSLQHSFATYLVEASYTGNSSVNGFENREINALSYDWAQPAITNRPVQQHRQHLIYRPYPTGVSPSDQRRDPITTPVPSNSISAFRAASRSSPSILTRRGSIPAAAIICSRATWTVPKAAATALTSTPAA